MMVKRPDLNNTRYCDTIAEAQYGQVKSGKVVPVTRLTLQEVLAANERAYGGGSWK